MSVLWSRHPWFVSIALAVSVAAGLLLLSSETSAIRHGDGAGLYTAVVTAAAALAALGVVPISIVLGLSSPRVQELTRDKSAGLRRTVAAAVAWHLLTVSLAVIALSLDSSKDPISGLRAVAVAFLLVGVEATMRAVAEFLALLRLEARTSQTIGERDALGEQWVAEVTKDSGPPNR